MALKWIFPEAKTLKHPHGGKNIYDNSENVSVKLFWTKSMKWKHILA